MKIVAIESNSFAQSFWSLFLDICIESRNIIFLTAFGVDFLAKKSKKGNLRLFYWRGQLRIHCCINN